MKIRKPYLTLAASLSALMLPASPASAQHGEHGQHEHEESEIVEPDTYAHAIEVIHARLEEIEALMDRGQLDKVHPEAAAIRDVAATLARLALDRGSGVRRSSIRKINLTARALAATFGPIDEAGDSGNLAGTRRVYDEMVALFKTLERYAPHGHETVADSGYSVDVEPTRHIEPGVSTAMRFRIKDRRGALVTRLEVIHEKTLHLMVVSEDLSWYAHEHPVAQDDGSLALRLTFPGPGEYVLFHDFAPSGAREQVVPVTVHVEGVPPRPVPLVVDSASLKLVDGYSVRLETAGPIRAGREAVLSYNIVLRRQPVTDLEPYLGAIGHLAVVSENLEHFVHSHPLGRDHVDRGHHEEESQRRTGGHDEHREHGGFISGATGATVSFHALFPEAGLYKAWAQFKHRGRVFTVPFVIDVEPGAGRVEDDHRGSDRGTEHHEH